MENVPLRKDALSSLDLPVRVTAGFVGKIRLSIPVRRLSSEPWSISIEQLYVVLGPVRPEEVRLCPSRGSRSQLQPCAHTEKVESSRFLGNSSVLSLMSGSSVT